MGAGFPQIVAWTPVASSRPAMYAPPSSSKPSFVRQNMLRCMPTSAAPFISSRKMRLIVA